MKPAQGKSLRFVVVVVEPKYDGNVGALARAMANFGLGDLVLVNPPNLGDEAKERALHAWPILERARHAKTFEEALLGIDYVVGTASDVSRNEKRDLRAPTPLRDFAARIYDLSGTVGLLFGREDFGLVNEEMERCDIVVKIPTDARYPSMNLSHAAAVVFYELFSSRYVPRSPLVATGNERELLFEQWDRLLRGIELPPHRVRVMNVTFRRILGRAMLSKWEFHRLMGVVGGVLKRLERSSPAKGGGRR